MLKELAGSYAFVAKIDVSNLDNSTKWYAEMLGLIPDARFDAPSWRQLNIPGIRQVAIGMNLNPPGVGSGTAVNTFIVNNINQAREILMSKGVKVSDIVDVGHGVLLCFFNDLDKNSLGLRQNADTCPSAEQIGCL